MSGLSVRLVRLWVLSASVLSRSSIHRAGRRSLAAFEVLGSCAALWTSACARISPARTFPEKSVVRAQGVCLELPGCKSSWCLSPIRVSALQSTVFCVKWSLCASPLWRHRASWTHRLGPRGSEPDTAALSASPLRFPPQDSALTLPPLPRLPGGEGSPSHTHTPRPGYCSPVALPRVIKRGQAWRGCTSTASARWLKYSFQSFPSFAAGRASHQRTWM